MANTCPLCGGNAEATEAHRRQAHMARAQTVIEIVGADGNVSRFKVGYNINKQPVLYDSNAELPKDVYSELAKVPEQPKVENA